MAQPRKTVEVKYVLDSANAYLRLTPDEHTEGRMAVANLLESVLMATDTYRGFGYIKSNFDKDGIYQDNEPVRYNKGETDESRRQYYRHPKLDR